MKRVAVIDYDAGNIFNVTRAFEYLDCDTRLCQHADDLANSDYLVLPGVGAFGDGMASLRKRDLVEPILNWVASGKPFIGICLGMQLLLSSSEEFGNHSGLALVPGEVRRLPSQPGLKVPNIGWHTLVPGADIDDWSDSHLRDIEQDRDMYFVHSYAAYPEHSEHWLARTAFGDHWFCSVIGRDNVFGCQFHPEKSGVAGLRILRRFLEQTD
jgi:glutamine amidotransferase